MAATAESGVQYSCTYLALLDVDVEPAETFLRDLDDPVDQYEVGGDGEEDVLELDPADAKRTS